MIQSLVKHDWPKVRDAFVSESPRPTYQCLADRFGIPVGTLARVASDEGWPDMRKARLAQITTQGDAMDVIARAATEANAASGLIAESAQGILVALVTWLPSVEKVDSPRARIDMLNTASFALMNAATACDRAGITGMAVKLKNAAREVGGLDGRGKWNPELIQQINVTVQQMKAAAKIELKSAVAVGTEP